MKRVAGKIIPGSLRIKVVEYAYVTVECCNCGHQQDASPDARMPWCCGCGHQMVLREAADAGNVTPLRRKRATP